MTVAEKRNELETIKVFESTCNTITNTTGTNRCVTTNETAAASLAKVCRQAGIVSAG